MIDERSNKFVPIRMAVPVGFDTDNYINFRIFVSRMTARGDSQMLWSHDLLTTHRLMYQKHTHFIEFFWKQVSCCSCETLSSIFKCLASHFFFFTTNSAHTQNGSFQQTLVRTDTSAYFGSCVTFQWLMMSLHGLISDARNTSPSRR